VESKAGLLALKFPTLPQQLTNRVRDRRQGSCI
jgi:hypothetical protein